jgi:hypothetical protein
MSLAKSLNSKLRVNPCDTPSGKTSAHGRALDAITRLMPRAVTSITGVLPKESRVVASSIFNLRLLVRKPD